MSTDSIDAALKVFGNNVRKYRKDRGFSQETLAELVGVGQGQLSKIESGNKHTTTRMVEKLAAALGVGVADLWKEE